MRLAWIAAAVLAGACSRNQPAVQQATDAVARATGSWRSLNDPSAWRGYKSDTIPAAWTFSDGVLSKTRPVADIVSKDEFGDFELELEWKIGEAGNAGIFYRGSEEYDHIYWSGPEYQLLDDIK